MIKYKIKKIDIRDLDPNDRYDRGRQSTKVSIFETDTNPIEEFLSGFRWNKPWEAYRKQIIPVVLDALGQPLATTKVSWSQKCGCSCGCSPGFTLRHTYGPYKNVYVEVEPYLEQPELKM